MRTVLCGALFALASTVAVQAAQPAAATKGAQVKPRQAAVAPRTRASQSINAQNGAPSSTQKTSGPNTYRPVQGIIYLNDGVTTAPFAVENTQTHQRFAVASFAAAEKAADQLNKAETKAEKREARKGGRNQPNPKNGDDNTVPGGDVGGGTTPTH